MGLCWWKHLGTLGVVYLWKRRHGAQLKWKKLYPTIFDQSAKNQLILGVKKKVNKQTKHFKIGNNIVPNCLIKKCIIPHTDLVKMLLWRLTKCQKLKEACLLHLLFSKLIILQIKKNLSPWLSKLDTSHFHSSFRCLLTWLTVDVNLKSADLYTAYSAFLAVIPAFLNS